MAPEACSMRTASPLKEGVATSAADAVKLANGMGLGRAEDRPPDPGTRRKRAACWSACGRLRTSKAGFATIMANAKYDARRTDGVQVQQMLMGGQRSSPAAITVVRRRSSRPAWRRAGRGAKDITFGWRWRRRKTRCRCWTVWPRRKSEGAAGPIGNRDALAAIIVNVS
jgi:hypothetical protein